MQEERLNFWWQFQGTSTTTKENFKYQTLKEHRLIQECSLPVLATSIHIAPLEAYLQAELLLFSFTVSAINSPSPLSTLEKSASHVSPRPKIVTRRLTNNLITQIFLNRHQSRHNVLQKLPFRALFLDDLPKLPRLHEIPVCDLCGIALHLAVPDLVAFGVAMRPVVYLAEAGAHVVWVAAVVTVDGPSTITLVRGVDWGKGLVGWELLVVCP
jgi:hypothetical protein